MIFLWYCCCIEISLSRSSTRFWVVWRCCCFWKENCLTWGINLAVSGPGLFGRACSVSEPGAHHWGYARIGLLHLIWQWEGGTRPRQNHAVLWDQRISDCLRHCKEIDIQNSCNRTNRAVTLKCWEKGYLLLQQVIHEREEVSREVSSERD